MKLFITTFFSLLLFFNTINAQSDPDNEVKFEDNDDESFWGSMIFGEWDFDKHSKTIVIEESTPTIEVLYGKSTPLYYDDLAGDLNEMTSVEIRLGFVNLHRLNMNSSVVKFDYGFGYLNNSLENLGTPIGNGVNSDTWHFGISKSGGYGYLFGDLSNIVFFNANGLGWSKTKFREDAQDTLAAGIFNKFEDFNFCQNFEGGIAVRFIDNVSINGSFERNLVYPSHLFWYWALSGIIEQIAF